MKAKSLFFAALAIMMASCVQDPANEFVPEFKVSGVKGNAIEVSAAAKTVTVSVTANLSWSIDCKSDWVSVKPASYTAKDDKTSETIKVKVSVLENDVEEAREDTLTIAAEGFDPVKIAVKQEAKEHVVKTITVFDVEKYEPISGYSIVGPEYGGYLTITVQANSDWTVDAPEWISVSPASFTYSDTELAKVKIYIAGNNVEARSDKISFKGDFEHELVIPVSQAVASSDITATVKSVSYRNAIFDVDAPEGTFWAWNFGTDEEIEMYGIEAFVEGLISLYQEYATSWSSQGATDNDILASLADGYGPISGYDIDDNIIEPASNYNFVFIPFTVKDAQVSLAGNPSIIIPVTTEEAPVASEGYSAVLGTYVNKAYDYFESSSKEKDVYTDLVMVVEPYFINESVFISFTGGSYFPQTSTGVVDTFIGKYSDGKISIKNPQMGDLGFVWSTGLGTSAMVLNAFYLDSETIYIETLDFTADEGKLVASASPSSDVENDVIAIQSAIFVQDETGAPAASGYSTGIAIIEDPAFTKVVEEAPTSVSSVRPFEKKINKTFEKISKVYPAK